MNTIDLLNLPDLFSGQFSHKRQNIWFISSIAASSLLINVPRISAQIVPDNTLPQNSVVLPDASGNLVEIIGGTTVGDNLFHSFQEFSVLNGQTAFFNNGLTIENIFSRVTGSSISQIEGLIRANGTANLFLINPNGIIFGENASLNLGGSFISSTANSIQFSDGSFYSALDPEAPPLLTVNIPVGLQYGSESGNITVRGIGNSTGFKDPGNEDYSLFKDFRPSGLQVESGNTLALIGGNVTLDGGNLTAAEGQIELGSVKAGMVELEEDNGIWSFDYGEISDWQNINLSNAASLEVSGNSSGTVNLRGQNITLTDASAILANTSGDGTAGSINVEGTESIQIIGVSQNEIPFVSVISTDTTPGSTGAGANLNLKTNYLLVAGGAQVNSAVFGAGKGGTIDVRAEKIELFSGSAIANSSGIFAPILPGATGDGGDINIQTDSLLVAQGAQAFTLSVSSGKAGDFNLKAREIELNGLPIGFPSGLFTNTFTDGDGGNLNIETETLLLTDGADIGSTAGGVGKAGNINIKASSIELNGVSSPVDSSSISASVESGATGIAGDINIETDSLTLTDGTQINSNVFGSGRGGNVTVRANEIDLQGFSEIEGIPSGIFALVFPGAVGSSGNVEIETNNLTLIDGAQISVATFGSGSAGDLKVTASESIALTGNAIEAGGGSSGLFSSAAFGNGDGGKIDLVTDRLSVKDGATISASNFFSGNASVPAGTGKAGNIEIEANTISLDGIDNQTPASITAKTFAGGGGNIAIYTNSLTAQNGSQITAETTGEGNGGAIEIKTDNLTLNSKATVSSSTSATGDARTISVTSDLLTIDSQGEITTSSTGAGQAGNIKLDSDRIFTEEGLITATSTESGGGNIDITTDFIYLKNNSSISTSVLGSDGGGGNLTIASDVVLASGNSDLRANAVLGNGGNIDINTEILFTSLDSDIDASSQFGLDGIVNITSLETEKQFGITQLPTKIINPYQLVMAQCPVKRENIMVVSGKGGLPTNPRKYLSGESVWQDMRTIESVKETTNTSSSDRKFNSTTIVEANRWQINDNQQIELIANNPSTTQGDFAVPTIECYPE